MIEKVIISGRRKCARIFFIFSLVLATVCCHGHHHAYAAEGEKAFRIVASTFPVYLFTANICANAPNVDLQILVPAAAGCPHDFVLRPQDMQKLTTADALVINGAGLETFLEKILASMKPGPHVVDAGKDIPLIASAMAHEDHDHSHGHGDEMANPHIFAAPDKAVAMVRNIAGALAGLDPANAPLYSQNAQRYAAILEALAEKFRNVGLRAKNRGIALEHDALEYLALNANLKIVAVFENSLSAAGFMQMAALLKKDKPALLAGDSQYPDRLLKTLGNETGIPFVQLNPCANGPDNAPLDYYQTTMEENLDILNARFDK